MRGGFVYWTAPAAEASSNMIAPVTYAEVWCDSYLGPQLRVLGRVFTIQLIRYAYYTPAIENFPEI
jgi:hypothetical protein